MFKTPADHSGLSGLLQTQPEKIDEAVALRVHALQNACRRQQIGLLQPLASRGNGSGVILPRAERVHPHRHLLHAIQDFVRPLCKQHLLAAPLQFQPRLPAPACDKMLVAAQGLDFGSRIWRTGRQ